MTVPDVPPVRGRVKRTPRPTPARHRWVKQWMDITGDALRQLAADTIAAVDRYEAIHHPRIRARTAAARESHEALLRVLVANLAYAVLCPSPTGRLAIRAGNLAKGAGRQGNPAFGKGLRPLINMLAEMGLLDFQLPIAMRGEASSIAPTAEFAARVRALSVTLDDFGRDEREEVLVLTRNVGTVAARITDSINYAETAETTALRDQVRRLNAVLAKADIGFVDDGLSPRIDPHQRLLKRRFILLKGDKQARFDRGGRLFGTGFWQNLERRRRGSIRIQGEPIAELDYSSMFARLAYAAMGVQAPDGDLYALRGLEGYRSGVKLAFNVFLFDGRGRRMKWPAGAMGVGVGSDEDAKANHPRLSNDSPHGSEGRLPAGWQDPQRLRAAILAEHPALAKAFGRRLGFGLMFTESRVLMAALEELMLKRAIIALPLYDGLLVARSRADEAMDVMRESGLAIAGARLPVRLK